MLRGRHVTLPSCSVRCHQRSVPNTIMEYCADVSTRLPSTHSGCLSHERQAKRAKTQIYSTGPQDEGTRLLEEDMQRYSNKHREKQARQPSNIQEEDETGSGAKDLLDKLLIGDFFFVLLALAWLALGVAEKSTLNTSRLLDVWFPLWTLIFQPAIGVLMLGALASGGLGWLRSKKS